jgi:hypothetical protein
MCDYKTFIKGLASAGLIYGLSPLGTRKLVEVAGVTYEFSKDGTFMKTDIDEGLQ